MSNFKLTRRLFVSGAGTLLTLPWFESALENIGLGGLALADTNPRRFISFYFPNGTYNRADQVTWYPPTGPLTAGTLSPVLAPFGSVMGDLSIYRDIGTRASDNLQNQAGQHNGASVAFLTCSPNMNPNISFEHMIAAKVGKPAIVLQGNTADQGDAQADNAISFLNGRQVRGISNPGDLYRQLLGQVAPSAALALAGSPTTPVAKSILDSALVDLNQLRSRLGKSDQQRLDDYMSGVRSLELKLAGAAPGTPGTSPGSSPSTPTPVGNACVAPTNDAAVDSAAAAANGSLYLERMRAFNDLITIAFSCDITRSISVMLDVETGGRSLPAAPTGLVYQGADIAGWNNHLLSHFGHFESGDYAHSTPDGIPRCITRDRFYLSVVVDLITKLKSARDANGGAVLDSTIVHAGFGVKDGMHNAYNTKSPPTLVAGGRNFLTPGQVFDFGGYDVSDMFYTFNNVLGLGMDSFQGSSKLMKL